ncbi:MAG TPA: hypothetical protein VI934_01680 [Candidatus Nanoarchaeia archaeon]|nr:hypothetical protein [Candidatus Nanoarchaeia archaeon]
MGTMTINISDETEQKFREKVKETLGEGKGKLGQAVEEAMNKWAEEDEQRKLRQEAIALLKKGLYKVGKNYTFKREEAYEDRYRKITGAN